MPSYFRISQEFAVNSRTVANQTGPSVATLRDGAFVNGGFVVVWVSQDPTEDGDGSAIKGQYYDPYGNPRGGEFLVNSAGAGSQFNPSVTGLGYSGFVVTWTSNDPTQDGSGNAIKAQLFARDGTPRGTEFLVNSQATSSQANPVVTHLTSGDFVISWDDWSGFDRKAQIFDSNGVKIGGEFRLNTNTAGMEEYGDIVGLTYGGFVATWRTTDPSGDGSGEAVKGQVFSNTGAKIGGEFLVNSATAGNQNDPSVTALVFGGFVVVWATGDSTQDGSGGAVKAQMFDSSGAKVGGELLVNTLAADTQREPVVTATNDGGFLVAWTSFNTAQDGSSFAIKAQAFSASGTKQGSEFLVNTLSAGAQFIPDIATFDDGRIVMTWASETGDGDGYSVRAQILEPNQRPRITSGGGGTSSTGLYVDEGQTLATTVVATDPDGPNPLRYSITGGYDAHLFRIDEATGELYFLTAPDYEAPFQGQNFYSVYVTVDDGELSTFQLVQISVRNVYEDVHFDEPSRAFSIDENGTAIGTLTAVRDSEYGLYYSIAGGADAHLFTIDMWTGALSFVSAPDFEIAADSNWDNVYDVLVSASDGITSAVQYVSVTVDDVDEGVFFFSHGGAAAVALTEGENVFWVDQVLAFAEDGADVTYSIAGGADAALFAVDPVTGELTFLYEARPDFEAPTDAGGDNVYDVIVAASAAGHTATQAFAITVFNNNEGVWITSNGGDWRADITVAENQGAVTTVTAFDPDGTVPTFMIFGGADAALFTIDAQTGVLSFISNPDHEFPADADGDNVYNVLVAANDGDYATAQDLFITVANVNEAVVITSNGGGATAAVEANENQSFVTTIVAEDYDETFPTFAIVGGADAARFTIDAATGVLQFVSAPDHEAPGDADGDNVYDVVVRATDGSLFDDQALSVTVASVDEGLAITSYGGAETVALSLAENGSAAGQVAAVDVDGEAVTYLIVGGADAGLFQVDSATGALSFVSSPDFEAPADSDGDNVYTVEVAAISGAFTDNQAFAVTVTNSNEALAITSNGGGAAASVSVAENSRDVTTVAAVDPDGTSASYSIVGGADAARFTINAQTGLLEFATAPDHEVPGDANGDNVYSVIVQASDGQHVDLQTLSVSVLNLRDGNNVTGTTGGDSISGTSTSPALRTTNAEDSVSGRDGHDTILGLGGDDWLSGDAGNDVLNGGLGADRLTGGLGKDQFVYNAVSESTPGARDVITDFSRAQSDKISLSGIDANSVLSGNQAFTYIGAAAFSGAAGQLRYSTSGGVTLVSGDINGDAVADFQIELSGTLTPIASDFVL